MSRAMHAATRRAIFSLSLAALALVAVAGAAVAAEPDAQAAAGAPRIADVACVSSCTAGRPRGGSLVLISGSRLRTVERAVFAGGRGGVRRVRGRAGSASSASVRVRVPWEAVSGGLVLGTSDGSVSDPVTVRMAPVPVVARWRCIAACAPKRAVRGGSLLLVRGVRLQNVTGAVMHNGRGRADDTRARVSDQRFSSFRMRVPRGAVTGTFVARGRKARSPARRLKVRRSAAVTVPAGGIFPVRGRHDFGGSGARFGTGRSGHRHQGQDVMSPCGTPLVAARGGRVRFAGYQSAAGNYIVIDGTAPNWDYVYMHLRSKANYRTGARVPAGARLGEVGETGNAQGCHLHVEIWGAPGWYEGGKPFDPLPQLRAWDRTS